MFGIPGCPQVQALCSVVQTIALVLFVVIFIKNGVSKTLYVHHHGLLPQQTRSTPSWTPPLRREWPCSWEAGSDFLPEDQQADETETQEGPEVISVEKK